MPDTPSALSNVACAPRRTHALKTDSRHAPLWEEHLAARENGRHEGHGSRWQAKRWAGSQPASRSASPGDGARQAGRQARTRQAERKRGAYHGTLGEPVNPVTVDVLLCPVGRVNGLRLLLLLLLLRHLQTVHRRLPIGCFGKVVKVLNCTTSVPE